MFRCEEMVKEAFANIHKDEKSEAQTRWKDYKAVRCFRQKMVKK